MSKQYKVIGPCEVAGVPPGGTVTREQVEAFGGDTGIIHFDVLVGTHLEEFDGATTATAKDSDTATAKKGPK